MSKIKILMFASSEAKIGAGHRFVLVTIHTRAEDPEFAAESGGPALPAPLHLNISMRTRPILDIIGSNESPK